jgi:hypothetical protein
MPRSKSVTRVAHVEGMFRPARARVGGNFEHLDAN